MNRRTFLKIVGMGSISLAAGCTPDPYGQPRPLKNLFSLVNAPDDMVTGNATWYASTCRECPAGCGILAKNREGRVIKIEGNPHHPINKGKLCMRGQAALQGVYNPDRITTPLIKENNAWRSLSFAEATSLLKQKTTAATASGSNRVRMLTETVGSLQFKLLTEILEHWRSEAPLVYEPLAYEAVKAANKLVFGIDGLPSYRIEDADVLVSFGADFLETWLSPVEYARQFKTMHALHNGKKGLFMHVGPYQSLTGANADQWIACQPGSEAVIALGLLREALALGRPLPIVGNQRFMIENAAAAYSKDKVAELAGIPLPLYEKLIARVTNAKQPLALGTGAGATGPNALQTNMAVNYLNALLDPNLKRIDFNRRHRVEMAASRTDVLSFFKSVGNGSADVLLLNNVNPVYSLPSGSGVRSALESEQLFVVAFSNFLDETVQQADLIFPTRLPLESWDEYAGTSDIVATLQPAMGRMNDTPHLGDTLLMAAFGNTKDSANYKAYLLSGMVAKQWIADEFGWLQTLQKGGQFGSLSASVPAKSAASLLKNTQPQALGKVAAPLNSGDVFIAAPSVRQFDGRGSNRPWLNEVPDPMTRVAWQSPLVMHPQTMAAEGLNRGDRIQIKTKWGEVEAPIYDSMSVTPNVRIMSMGQGHTDFGRYAAGQGANPIELLPATVEADSNGPLFGVDGVSIRRTGRMQLANTDGSRTQSGRKIALSVSLEKLPELGRHKKHGLTMHDFPLTLPLPEGYDSKRDFYPPIEYEDYRWAMTVDLDRCIGCGACAVACYAENNIGIVGRERILEGREMAWLSVERYQEPDHLVFLPLMCQHCDNAPCESVCPVYAPHHNKEGMNNQIYNRCIGTRFCAQNCPYKVRRFNWFDWPWPEPTHLQLNPNVTVRAKGVMEKCSFCVQRIKEAHGWAKNEKRLVRDGEIIPACVQTCPTDALTFGNLMDNNSRVRRLVDDPRAYQIMGYLNTKPAVIYLKKVLQTV